MNSTYLTYLNIEFPLPLKEDYYMDDDDESQEFSEEIIYESQGFSDEEIVYESPQEFSDIIEYHAQFIEEYNKNQMNY
jgi:hypothetical protein